MHNKWKRTGSVLDDGEAMATKEVTVATEETKSLVSEIFEENPTESCKCAASRLKIPYSTLRNIMITLDLTPYKIQFTQPINDDLCERRMELAMRMHEMIDNKEIDIEKLWFSDEA